MVHNLIALMPVQCVHVVLGIHQLVMCMDTPVILTQQNVILLLFVQSPSQDYSKESGICMYVGCISGGHPLVYDSGCGGRRDDGFTHTSRIAQRKLPNLCISTLYMYH